MNKNTTKIILTTSILMLLSVVDLFAVKASPKVIKFREPNGTIIRIKLYGDERFNYIKSLDGYILSEGVDGYLHYANYNSGEIKVFEERYSSVPPDRVKGSTKTIPTMVYHSLHAGAYKSSNSSIELSSVSRGRSIAELATFNSLVLLVEFLDKKFTLADPYSAIHNMLNKEGYSDFGATGSASDYFKDNLSGCKIVFDVQQVISLPKTLAYYGEDSQGKTDAKINELIIDATKLAFESGVDFSKYDFDNDGIVDNVTIIYSGYDQAESGIADAIWAKQGVINNVSYNGVKLGSFVCVSELRNTEEIVPSGIGVFCHEFSHSLGLVDLYDTNGEQEGLGCGVWGSISIMDTGCYLNNSNTPPYYTAIERDCLGIFDTIILEAGNSYTIDNVSSNNSVIYRVNTTTNGEYFLLESKGNTGWDKYVGGEGLLVYHVDKSNKDYGMIQSYLRWTYNNVNAFSSHQCAYIFANEANYQNGVGYAFLPGKSGQNELSLTTRPKFVDWNGRALGISIKDIVYSSGKLSFNTVKERRYLSELPIAKNITSTASDNSVFFTWKTNNTYAKEYEWLVSVYNGDKLIKSAYTKDNYIKIYPLSPKVEYKFCVEAVTNDYIGDMVEYTFSSDKVQGLYTSLSFKKTYKVGDLLFILPINLTEPYTSLHWSVNSNHMHEGETFVIQSKGRYNINVYITYPDGSIDKFVKVINVK